MGESFGVFFLFGGFFVERFRVTNGIGIEGVGLLEKFDVS